MDRGGARVVGQGRRRPGVALGAVVVTLAALAGSVGPQGSRAVRGGPDRLPPPAVYLTEFEQGHTFSDAYSRVVLSGRTPGVLDRVQILGGDDYFELVGVKVAGADRKFGHITFAESYPPRQPRVLGPLADGAGAPLNTESAGSLLLVGLRVTREGIGSRTGLRVHYSVGDQHYYQDHPAAIVNCPPGTPRTECDLAFDEGFAAAVSLAD